MPKPRVLSTFVDRPGMRSEHTVNIANPSSGPGHLPAHNTIRDSKNAMTMASSARTSSAKGEMENRPTRAIFLVLFGFRRLFVYVKRRGGGILSKTNWKHRPSPRGTVYMIYRTELLRKNNGCLT